MLLPVCGSHIHSKYFERRFAMKEYQYSTKKREHSFSILKVFFIQHLAEYEMSDLLKGELKYTARCFYERIVMSFCHLQLKAQACIANLN